MLACQRAGEKPGKASWQGKTMHRLCAVQLDMRHFQGACDDRKRATKIVVSRIDRRSVVLARRFANPSRISFGGQAVFLRVSPESHASAIAAD